VSVRYVGGRPVRVRGAVSQRMYAFSRAAAVQPVDAADASGLLRSGLFQRL